MTRKKLIAYIDGSGSTQTQGTTFQNLGAIAVAEGWNTFEFSTEVRTFIIGQQPFLQGTSIPQLTKHAQEWHDHHLQETGEPPRIVVFTDEDHIGNTSAWDHLIFALGAKVVRVHDRISFLHAGTILRGRRIFGREWPFDSAADIEHMRQTMLDQHNVWLSQCGVDKRLSDKRGLERQAEINRMVSERARAEARSSEHNQYNDFASGSVLKRQAEINRITFERERANQRNIDQYNTPSRPQEAPMSKPTIVTSVTLARVTGHEQVVIGDLKSLIAEVERVGGNDDSTVDLSNDTRTWNVALVVKANEVEREVEVTDEQRIALLNEAKTASKTRKTEIKTLLGL